MNREEAPASSVASVVAGQADATGGHLSDLRLRAAARELVTESGLAGLTATALARRAGVSRMTLYRRGASPERIVLDALTDDVRALATPVASDPIEQVVEGCLDAIRALRANPLYRAVQAERPDLLLPYAVERFGGVQSALRDRLVTAIEAGQATDDVRAGEPDVMASTLVVALQGFVLAQRDTLEPEGGSAVEAATLIRAYLRPGASA